MTADLAMRRKILRALNYSGVELLPSHHRDQFDEVCATFIDVSNDSLLYPFRVRKGLDAPGEPLPGWYGIGLFNNLGQFLTLYARLYAASGDARFAEKAVALLRGWEETIDDDGYCFASRTGFPAIEYSFDKFVCGLLDIHEYIGVEGVLSTLKRISTWMLENQGDAARGYANGLSSLEWYTLPEYLLRAHSITGDPLYVELAERYLYDEFFDAVRESDIDALMRRVDCDYLSYQAHSHLNSLNSAAAMYELTGDVKYLITIEAGYELLQGTQVFATGMFGPLEEFMKPRQRAEVLHSEVGHAEISCPSWAMNRFVRHLIELTGGSRYGDWMELNLYNGIGAAPPTRSDGRALQYFADYGLDHASKTWGIQWSCCSTTNPISITEYANQIYYTARDALYVCLYLPSTISCPIDGRELRLTQRTTFPMSEMVHCDVRVGEPVFGRIGFRVPGWVAGTPGYSINGEVVDAAIENGWATFARMWSDGDVISLRFPMTADLVPVEPAYYDGPVALRYGPVVLVMPQGDGTKRLSLEDARAVARTLTRVGDGQLRFTGLCEDGRSVRFVPYYEMPPDEPYAMYIDDDDKRISCAELTFEPPGAWRDVDNEQQPPFTLTVPRRYKMSSEPDAEFSLTFEGTGVVWCGYRSLSAGYADVYIDGEFVDRVSQLGTWNLQPSMWSTTGLAPDRHELRVVVVGEAPTAPWRLPHVEAPPGGHEVNVGHVRVIS